MRMILCALAALVGNVIFFALVMAWLVLLNELINH